MQTTSSAPKTVKVAILSTTVGYLVGIPRLLMEFDAMNTQHGPIDLRVLIFGHLFTILLVGALLHFVYRRKNWARYINVVMCLISLPMQIPATLSSLKSNLGAGLIGVLQVFFTLFAIYLLLLPRDTRDWFKG